MYTKRSLAVLAASCLFLPPSHLQSQPTAPAKGAQAPATITNAAANAIALDAGKNGVPLTTLSDLSGSVSVEAVLLPYNVSKRTFGKEVASRYAVISLIVSNRDPKQGVILHSVFLDYSKWLFSGIFSGMSGNATVQTQAWQQQTNPSQVASAEVRTVRTDFQDAQLWSVRSWVIHIATAVGAAAGAVSFSTANDLFAPSVSAFNSQVVPALSVIWPDNSQTQLNLLNDIGFRTNHVIAAKSSDVVIAFFPLERFLTPKLQSIYKKAPAAFFNPSELIFEKAGRSGVGELLKEIEDSGLIKPSDCPAVDSKPIANTMKCALVKSITNYEQSYEKARLDGKTGADANPCKDTTKYPPVTATDCFNVDILNRVSLNTIRVVVGGIMTVDVSSVPATISSVQIANGAQTAAWKSTEKITGTLSGNFLSGGIISIAATDPTARAIDSGEITGLQVDQTTATDSTLPFSFTIGAADVAAGSKFAFTVAKTGQDKSTTASSPYIYNVTFNPTLKVDTSSTWTATGKITGTITGTGLANVTITSVAASTGAPPSSDFTPTITTPTDTSLPFSVTIGATAVTPATTLVFTLSSKNPDGSPVTLSYTVPTT